MSYQTMKAEEIRKLSVEMMAKSQVPGLVATYTEDKKRSSLLFAHAGVSPQECLILLDDLRDGLLEYIEAQQA